MSAVKLTTFILMCQVSGNIVQIMLPVLVVQPLLCMGFFITSTQSFFNHVACLISAKIIRLFSSCIFNASLCAGSWHKAMEVMNDPHKAAAADSLMRKLIQCLWNVVGEGSDGTEREAKKLALQLVYMTLELRMLSDYSTGHAYLWELLDGRYIDTISLGEKLSEAQITAMLLSNERKVSALYPICYSGKGMLNVT
jgi:hypothetical protein